MSKIKYYKYLEIEHTDKFDICPIRITYSNGNKRIFRVKVNKNSVQINDKDKQKELVKKLIELGVLESGSPEQELYLQTLIMHNGELKTQETLEKLQPDNQEANSEGVKIKYYKFLKTEHIDKFDIYPIRITYSNEKQRIFRVRVNKNSMPINDKDKQKELVNKLKKSGVLEFGSLEQEIHLMHNGELDIQKPLKNDNTTPRNNNGKHYAISDIHGMYGSYMEAIRQLNDNDTLIVIGDAIDRGGNGIKILKDIISRKKDGKKPKVIFCLGNHEMQMIQVLDIIKKYQLNPSQIQEYCEVGHWLRYVDELKAEGEEENKTYIDKHTKTAQSLLQKMRGGPELSEDEIKLLYIWLMRNDGVDTFNEYYSLSQEEKEEIYRFLTERANILGKKEINGQKFLFVHAAPPYSKQLVELIKDFEVAACQCNKFSSIKERDLMLRSCTEVRHKDDPESWENTFRLWNDAGYHIIYGHTYNMGKVVENKEYGCICIDAGCGHPHKDAKLALYCIDDETVKYIEPREEERGTMQDVGDGR